MREYTVETLEEYKKFNKSMLSRYSDILKGEGKIPKLTIVVKRYRKSRSHPQLRKYWALLRAFNEEERKLNGENSYTEKQLHEIIKIQAGFTDTLGTFKGNTVTITKSFSDLSPDATQEVGSRLIEYIIRLGNEYLGVNLGDSGYNF